MMIVAQTSIEHVTTPKILRTKLKWSLQNCTTLFQLSLKQFRSSNFTLSESNQTGHLTFDIKEKKTEPDKKNKKKQKPRRIVREVEEEEVLWNVRSIFKIHPKSEEQLATQKNNKGAVLTLHLNPSTQESLDLIITASIILNNDKTAETVTRVTQKRNEISALPLINIDMSYIKDNYVQDNILRFVCLIEDVKEIESAKIDSTVASDLSIVKNFDKFYKEGNLCDVTFLFGDESVRAHSLVLASISPYFFNLFSGTNADNIHKDAENVIDLTNDSDFTLESIKAFLDYVYGCKKLKELQKLKCKLLLIAIKFAVVELENACVQMICDAFDEENIASILLFASKSNCNALKKEALNFAKSCIKTIVSSKEFTELSKDKSIMLQLF